MRGTIDFRQRHCRIDFHVNRQLTQWMLAQQLTLQAVMIDVAIAASGQDLCVSNFDPLFRPSQNRKDTSLKNVSTRPL